VYIW